MLQRTFQNHDREEGQMLVMGVLLLAVMLGMLGIIIDGGSYLHQRRQAQNAADAAAQAAAAALRDGASVAQASAAATEYASANGYTTGGNVTVTVNIPPTSGPHKGTTGYAEVIISQKPKTFFIQAVVPAANGIAGRGVAGFISGPPCALCVLSAHAHKALDLSNNGYVTVQNGGVTVNSDQTDAGYFNNNASLTATSFGVVGGTQQGNNATISPAPTHGIAPLPDPMASVPVPSVSGPNKGSLTLTNNASQTINPGIYTDLTVSNNGTLTFSPGTYVITGTLNVSNNGIVNGSGVTLYFACSTYPTPCSSGQAGGQLNLSNNAVYSLTAPTSGTYQGLTIFYDRNNTSPITLENNAGDSLTGTIYALSSNLNMSNNSGVGQLDSLIIVATATLSNNASINIAFDKTKNYQLTSSSALVE